MLETIYVSPETGHVKDHMVYLLYLGHDGIGWLSVHYPPVSEGCSWNVHLKNKFSIHIHLLLEFIDIAELRSSLEES